LSLTILTAIGVLRLAWELWRRPQIGTGTAGTVRWGKTIRYRWSTASELVGDHVEIADVGWRGEELVGFLREGFPKGRQDASRL